MRKIIIFLVTSLFLHSIGFAQDAKIEFLHSWQEALNKSKIEDKPIFLDAYTTWCKPCILMDKNIFPKTEVADYINGHFVPVKLDMDKPENAEVKERYSINRYPTFLFVDSKGEMMHRECGIKLGQDHDWFLKDCETALDQTNNLRSTIQKFNNGPQNMEAHIDYLSKIRYNCYTDTAATDYFIDNLTIDHLYNPKIPEMLTWTKLSLDHPIMDTVIKYKDDLTAFHENNSIDRLIQRKYEEELKRIIDQEDWESYRKHRAEISNIFKGNNLESLLQLDIAAYEKQKAWTAYVNAVDTLDQSGDLIPSLANNYSYTIYENVADPILLNRALSWIEKIALKDDDYYYLDTYAALLFKLGRKDEGVKYAKKAIKIASENQEDYSSTVELLNKYQNE